MADRPRWSGTSRPPPLPLHGPHHGNRLFRLRLPCLVRARTIHRRQQTASAESPDPEPLARYQPLLSPAAQGRFTDPHERGGFGEDEDVGASVTAPRPAAATAPCTSGRCHPDESTAGDVSSQ